MVRRYTPSQFRSKLRQAEQKIRQAQNKYNQEVRRINQKINTAISKHNQAVRAYNARVRANRQRLRNELAKLSRQPAVRITTRTVTYRTSVEALHSSYAHLDQYADTHGLDERYNRVLDLSERETANSLEVTNRVLGDETAGDTPAEPLEDGELRDGLRKISPDLDSRWKGAVYALSPQNPDAARHFCTSAREIITEILEITAPDTVVFAALPGCDRTDRGNATRRSKVRYFLHRQGMALDALEDFVEKDIENIVQLFDVFNTGTHDSAGAFDMSQLKAIRKRVEDGITFLTWLYALWLVFVSVYFTRVLSFVLR